MVSVFDLQCSHHISHGHLHVSVQWSQKGIETLAEDYVVRFFFITEVNRFDLTTVLIFCCGVPVKLNLSTCETAMLH